MKVFCDFCGPECEERGASSKLSFESLVAGVCFIICAAACTILSDSEQVKTWLSLSACGSSFIVLLAPRALQGRRSARAQNEARNGRSTDPTEEQKFDASPDRFCGLLPKLRTKRMSKIQRFESALQVIHEDATLAMKAFAAKELSQDRIAMIIAAVYSLATQRKKWAKRPDETWGKFLTKLDAILAKQAKPSQPALLMPSEAWYEISRWCARHSLQDPWLVLQKIGRVESFGLHAAFFRFSPA